MLLITINQILIRAVEINNLNCSYITIVCHFGNSSEGLELRALAVSLVDAFNFGRPSSESNDSALIVKLGGSRHPGDFASSIDCDLGSALSFLAEPV